MSMFIVFEGIDGCGKSTHARLAAQWLEQEGLRSFLTSEPTSQWTGKFIRQILSGKEEVDPMTLALLFTADRYEHLAKEVDPAIEEGKIVVCERYTYSTIAYQHAQGLSWNWLHELNKYARKPDLTILLDVPPQEGEKRTETGEIFEKAEFLGTVRDNYLKFDDLVRIDSSRAQDAVAEDVRKAIGMLL
ncbi:dTMP kinase [Candidatus Altiarchaeota archaeon]